MMSTVQGSENETVESRQSSVVEIKYRGDGDERSQ